MRKATAYHIRFLSIWAMLLGLGSPVAASESPSDQKLAANFEMTRTLAVLSDTLSSSGKLVLGGPGLLRWETVSPSRSLLVVNRGQAWIQYPDLGVTKQFDIGNDPVMEVLSEHLFALTKGQFEKLDKWYQVKEKDGAKQLVPKQKQIASVFSEIRVSLGARGVVRRVEMVSTGGDITVIEFKNVRLNPPLAPNTFRID
jgi:outer membrane lipoprotein-sorting protein